MERLCLSLLVLLTCGWMCEAEWYIVRSAARNRKQSKRQPASLSFDDPQPARPLGKPEPRKPAQSPSQLPAQALAKPQAPVRPPVQAKQALQAQTKPLTWQYPKAPEPTEQPVGKLVLVPPEPARSVATRCGEKTMKVEAKLDLFGTRQLMKPEDVSLGGCASTGLDLSAQVLLFESELHTCGSVLTMAGDDLVYTFTLIYTPTPDGAIPIVRTNSAMVSIECRYLRKHNVSSDDLRPTWIPFSANKVSEDSLVFSLRLMTDDWHYERSSNMYFLGDMIQVEASVEQNHHVPLRVFVDSCVATLVPDAKATPRHDLIQNHGCLTDSLLTDSRSRFLARSQSDKLHLQLEAFHFMQQARPSIYVSCRLKATATSSPIDTEYKACSFVFGNNGWGEADGDDEVCGCCETTCGKRKGRSLALDTDMLWEGEAMLGPIVILQGDQEMQPEALKSQMTPKDQSAAGRFSATMALVAVVTVMGLVCVILLTTMLHSRRNRPSAYRTCVMDEPSVSVTLK